MQIKPTNWEYFQHYHDRRPAWIKLHRSLLDDYDFHCLPVASKALAPCLWLLASEYERGEIPTDPEKIAFRLRMSEDAFKEAVKPLILKQFFIADSEMLAACKLPAIPEKRKRREEKRRISAKAPENQPKPAAHASADETLDEIRESAKLAAPMPDSVRALIGKPH